MALIDLITGNTLLSGYLIYRFVYSKKYNNYYILLIIISLLPCISIFRQGVYQSGDFTQHVERAMVFSDALKEGHLIPSWAGILNSGYGYPVFLFIYLIPYYLMSALHVFGSTFIFAEK